MRFRRARYRLLPVLTPFIALGLFVEVSHAATVWAVGDGAIPEDTDDRVAARMQLEGLDRLLYLGDVYGTGTATEYATRYHPSFGRFKSRTHPTPGNHEWDNRATGYDPYWGSRAPRTGGGHWYSFDFAGWHFISLNSLEPHGEGSAQLAWLRRDLARYSGSCTIAFDHYPRHSAGGYGDRESLEPAWQAMSGRAVALLSAHEHNYQRFRPRGGITQFVVGTGGRDSYAVNKSDPRLAFATDDDFGALRMGLGTGFARFEFVALDGRRLDASSIGCRPHGRATVAVVRPARGRSYARGLRTLRGRAYSARGPVRLTLVRAAGRSRCAAFTGRSFRASSCRTRRSFRARGVNRWGYRLSRSQGLRRGRYRLTARVRGLDGRVASRTVRFRVR